ncbi:hypothetical protein CapIbe_003336 [Capra ibex]
MSLSLVLTLGTRHPLGRCPWVDQVAGGEATSSGVSGGAELRPAGLVPCLPASPAYTPCSPLGGRFAQRSSVAGLHRVRTMDPSHP